MEIGDQFLIMAANQTIASDSLEKPRPESAQELFVGGGEMGALMRAHDWSSTALGPVREWPKSLRIAVRILLGSGYPMLICWGPEYTMLYNDAYRPILGRTKHPGALGRSCQEVFSEAWDFIGPLFGKVMRQGEDASTLADQLFLLNRNGYLEESYFTFSYSPIPDDDGQVGGVFVTALETTERVLEDRARETVRELAPSLAEARTEQDVCRIAAEVAAKNPLFLPFVIFYVYRPEKQEFVLASSAGVNNPVLTPAVIDSDSEDVWRFAETLKSGTDRVIERLGEVTTDLPVSDWGTAVESAWVAPIKLRGDRVPAGFLVAGINPRRAFDERYRKAVQGVVDQIATAIAGARAYEYERRRAEALAELDRQKTMFFSNVSHEFRTPLTLMLGPLEQVLSEFGTSLPKEGKEQLTVARRNALRLLKLVNTLLEFSRIEAGRIEAVYEATDLSALTAEIASVFRSAMDRAGLKFTVDVQPLCKPVYVDREMWEKIVLNVISNAFKFTFEGEVAVSVREMGDHVELAVRDTGTGIPAEELPRVFERFHRIENHGARTYEGTGIGLALVQELVRLHGGNVQVESTVGRGSTFTVSIPFGSAHLASERIGRRTGGAVSAMGAETYLEEAQRWLPQDPEALKDQAHGAEAAASRRNGGLPENAKDTLVVVDDNADMREYVARLLSHDYLVVTCADGHSALEKIRELRPALVLSDIMMPGMSGLELLEAVRSDRSLSGTPVILLSARAGEEAEFEGLQAGADDYLVKPFTAGELQARVRSHVGMAKLRRDSQMRLEAAFIALQRLAAIVESSEDAIISKDLTGRVTSWNPAAERMFEYSEEEMVGRSITEIIPPQFQEDETRILETIGRGERIEHFETLRLTKSGKLIDVSLTISPVRDESGRIIGAAKIARDITHRKQTERALHMSERLASVGRLASTIAHEINNPLEAITNLVYLARENSSDKDTRELLEHAEHELERVSLLTKQTLGFYRETKGVMTKRLGELLPPLIAVFASRAGNKAISIENEIRRDPPIECIPGEIRQLFANLLNNSIDAVQPGGRIRVRVAASRERSGQGREGVRLTVADSGPGIPNALRGKLFEPFFTTKADVGTGLGLWVCQSIVQKHGGRISVRSCAIPGRSWTAFSVFLPQKAPSLSS